MPSKPKVLVVFTTPATLKELLASSAELELLALREPKQLASALEKHQQLAAVVVEHAKDRRLSMDLLQSVRTIRPSVRRIAVADPEDLSGLFEGLSSGTIDEIVYRPVDPAHLVAAVISGAKPVMPGMPAAHVAPIRPAPVSANR